MELLLWLYLYDHRWLFDLKMGMRIYKLLWLLPLCLHFGVMMQGVIFYYLEQSAESLFHIIFSALIFFNIIFFIFKIRTEEKLHMTQQTKVTQLFKNSPHLKPLSNNFWIRKHSVFSLPGISLLLLSIFSLIWSYCISSTLKFTYSQLINFQPVGIVELQALIVFYGNVLFLLIATSLINIKLFFYIASFLCPRAHSYIAHLVHSKKSRLVIHYSLLPLGGRHLVDKSSQM